MAAWGEIPLIIALPFVLNLVFTFFTWLQFGLQNNALAAIDILLYLAHYLGAGCYLSISRLARAH